MTSAASSWCSAGENRSTSRRCLPRESLEDSKTRHQRLMIAKLELGEGMTVIDVGCGIGGPMRRVIREAGVRVLGVNSNDIQLEKAKSLNAEAGLDHMVRLPRVQLHGHGRPLRTTRSTGATLSNRRATRRTRSARSPKSTAC